ncbi:MAG TPA: hypothetical protein DCZ91_14780 [Lachnospiraceae bacterium]|nr:hypothetical protein [Lachnospiraceae bacterium]
MDRYGEHFTGLPVFFLYFTCIAYCCKQCSLSLKSTGDGCCRITSHLKEKLDKEFADSVLEVCLRADGQLIKRLKGDDTMSGALLEIMEPIILEREKKAKNEGIEQGIIYLVDAFHDLGHNDAEIIKVVMTKYGLTEEKARKYL